MKIFLGAVLIPALALGQSLNGLPGCAQTCALNAIGGSGCAVTDVACICSSATFISSYSSCVATSCNATDAAAAAAFGVQYCASAGVTIATVSAAVPATSPPASSAASSVAQATTQPATQSSSTPIVSTAYSSSVLQSSGSHASTAASPSVSNFTGGAERSNPCHSVGFVCVLLLSISTAILAVFIR